MNFQPQALGALAQGQEFRFRKSAHGAFFVGPASVMIRKSAGGVSVGGAVKLNQECHYRPACDILCRTSAVLRP
jgi:hypothetical protein